MLNSIFSQLFEGPLRPSGAVVSATIPISERALNDVFRKGGKVSGVKVLNDNNIRASMAGIPFPIDATIVSIDTSLNMAVRLNGMVARLASNVVVKFLSRYLPAGVQIQDRLIHVAIGALPLFGDYKTVLQHLESISISTKMGIVFVNFKFVIR